MYQYFIDNKEVSLQEFVNFIAEECIDETMEIVSGFGMSIPKYDEAEKLVKSMKRKAYRKWKEHDYYHRYYKPASETIIYIPTAIVTVDYIK